MKVKVKEKVSEMKEWVKEHRHDIAKVCFGVGMACLGFSLGGIYGGANRFKDGIAFGRKSILSEFGEGGTSMTKLTNCDTGLVDALMTRKFYDVMVTNSDIIYHDDGSWDFRSEVE